MNRSILCLGIAPLLAGVLMVGPAAAQSDPDIDALTQLSLKELLELDVPSV